MSLGIDGQRIDELRSAPRVDKKKIKILEKKGLQGEINQALVSMVAPWSPVGVIVRLEPASLDSMPLTMSRVTST